jgi:hypothetical protein
LYRIGIEEIDANSGLDGNYNLGGKDCDDKGSFGAGSEIYPKIETDIGIRKFAGNPFITLGGKIWN